MGYLIQLLLEPLFAVLSDVFWWLVPNEIERRNDRRRLLDGEVRVVSIRDRDASISPGKNEYLIGGWLDFIVTTVAGELIVRFPLEVGDAAAKVLNPHPATGADTSTSA